MKKNGSTAKKSKTIEKSTYHLNTKEYSEGILKSIGITVAIMFLFYRSFWAAVLFPLVLFVELKQMCQQGEERKQAKLQEEFLHGIGVLNSSLQAGLSMENAWREVEKELLLLYSAKSQVYLEIKEINQRVAHNMPIERLFLEFAYRSRLDDVIQFAELLEFGKRSGSNWKMLIDVTVNQIVERHAARQEIDIMVAEKKMEQKIMNIMPLGLLGFLQFAAGDYMSVLYHNWLGVICMTVFLVGYVLAAMLSQRILKVDI